MRLNSECLWCAAPFERSLSGVGQFCCVPCMEEATEAVETAWGGEAA